MQHNQPIDPSRLPPVGPAASEVEKLGARVKAMRWMFGFAFGFFILGQIKPVAVYVSQPWIFTGLGIILFISALGYVFQWREIMNKSDEKKLAYVFGVAFVVVLLVVAIFFPSPTAFQYAIFRIVLALAAAGVAAMIPGFLEVNWSTAVRAGGALGVFVIVYFFAPAALSKL